MFTSPFDPNYYPNLGLIVLECSRTQELLKKAFDRIATLEDQINKSSKNSSKPHSSDQKINTRNNPRIWNTEIDALQPVVDLLAAFISFELNNLIS